MFFQRRKKLALVSAALLSFGLLATGCASGGNSTNSPGATEQSEVTAEEFFKGKTVTLVVPFKPGGGTDVSARQLAPLLSKFLPGEPTVQIENIEGANGVLGANQYAKRNPDGLNLIMTSASTNMAYIFGDSAVDYSFDDWTPIVGVPAGAVIFASTDTGIEKSEDIFDVEPGELIYGGITPGGGEMPRILGFHLLGADVKTVFGYDSRATLQIAFQQGEVTIDGQGTSTFNENIMPLVEAGEAVPVYSQGMFINGALERDPAFPDLPHLEELVAANGGSTEGVEWDAYRFLVTAANNLQKPIWVHNDAPQVAIDAYAAAFKAMEASAEYQDTIKDTIGYDLVFDTELTDAVKVLTNPDQKAVDWLVNFAREEYNADLSK